jgi:hypothetical protein
LMSKPFSETECQQRDLILKKLFCNKHNTEILIKAL